MITYEEWADYSDSDDAAGSLRCTFVLEPLIAFLGDRGVTDEMADAVGFMVRNNMRCSQLSLLANVDRTMVHGQIAIRAALGKLWAPFLTVRADLPKIRTQATFGNPIGG